MRALLFTAVLLFSTSPSSAQHCDAGLPLGPKLSVESHDDDFDGALGGQWTVVFGREDEVDLFRTTAVRDQVYDLATLPGYLLMQTSVKGEDMVALRQDYELCDGCSAVARFAISTGGKENAYAVGLGVNDDDDGPLEGEWYQAFVDAERNQMYRMLTVVTNRVHLNSQSQPDQTSNPSAALLIRIIRRDLTYTSWYSNDNGTTWAHFGTRSFPAALDNLWIFYRLGSGNMQAPQFHTPIEAVDWVCIGTDDYSPW